MSGGSTPRVARPRLNDLTGSEWVRFTKSWFITRPPPRSAGERRHPAKFPEELCEGFVRFFTSPGGWVFDPFAGTGSALVAAVRLQRRAFGIELHPEYARLARERLRQVPGSSPRESRVVLGDARAIPAICRREGIGPVQMVLTSPPYWDMLSKSRGGSRSAHRYRATGGLPTTYSGDRSDLGNLHDYSGFVAETVHILRSAGRLLEPGRYMVVVAQNLRDVDGRFRTLAWDLARALDQVPFQFQGERIWCQDSKPLGIWGFPSTFVPNYHHHYCLVFRRQPESAAPAQPPRPRRTSAESSVSIRSATSR